MICEKGLILTFFLHWNITFEATQQKLHVYIKKTFWRKMLIIAKQTIVTEVL